MAVNPHLHDAEAVFRELGWQRATVDDVATLPLGTREQKARAIAGLKSGDWSDGSDRDGAHEWAGIVDVDPTLLTMFAIRLGVPARRAVELLYRVPFAEHFVLLRDHSPAYLREIIRVACRSDRRAWEHSLSVLGSVAVALVTRLNMDIPHSLEYLKDWAAIAAWNVAGHPIDASFSPEDVPTLADLTPSFRAHIDAACALNVPATGPFRFVLPGAVDAGLLSREDAVTIAFDALAHALRPGDRKQWVLVLRDGLQVSDAELADRFDLLIPVIATGEAAMVESLALPIFPLVTDEQLGELALCSLYVKTAKAKKAVLRLLATHPRPSDETLEMCVPRLQEITDMRDASLVKHAQAVLTTWGVGTNSTDGERTAPEGHADGEAGTPLWQATPPVWDMPRWEPPEPSFDGLSQALATLVHQEFEDEPTLELEAFLCAAVELSYADADAARLALQGCPRSLLNERPYEWVRQGPTERNPYAFGYQPLPRHIRPYALISRMGTLPCVLSAPSFVDMTITVVDLCERLSRYAQAGVPVLASDFVVALMRCDVSTATVDAIQELLPARDVAVISEDGALLDRHAGQVLADYVTDPFVEPACVVDESMWGGWRMEHPRVPASLAGFPVDSIEQRVVAFSLADTPLWRVFPSHALSWSQEIDRELGVKALQAARLRAPLSGPLAINLLACQRPSKDAQVTNACAQALRDAWSRGLLQPGIADILYMDWHLPLINIASFAKAMRECAYEGLLSVIWPVCDDLLSYSLALPRLCAGTAEVADVMAELAPAVVSAIEEGVAPQEAGAVPGLRALAARSGSSKAVVSAREALKVLPPSPVLDAVDSDTVPSDPSASSPSADIQPFDDSAFSEQWVLPKGADPQAFTAATFLSDRAENVWDDGVVLQASRVGDVPGRRALCLDLSFPGCGDIVRVAEVGWFFNLVEEGQVRGVFLSSVENDTPTHVWAHWNGGHDWALEPKRNWLEGTDGPLKGDATPLSPSLLAVVLAAQCNESDAYSARSALKDIAKRNRVTPSLVAEAMRVLLPFEAFSPARTVYLLERHRHLLPVLWPLLTESLRAAGNVVTAGQAPPRWVNTVLNVVQAHSQVLLSATLRGHIPSSEWEGITALAAAAKNSAARQKARNLVALTADNPQESA